MDTRTLHKGDRFEHVFLNEPVDIHIIQEAGSTVKIHILNLPSLQEKNEERLNRIIIDQTGPNCTTEIYGLAYLQGEAKVTTETHVNHLVGEGKSDQLIKFVLDDQAQGRFLGELKIAPDAQKVEAHQTNRNLVLSADAEMRTQPQLEIYADDVQASHGASTGQLDETALFYMQQRGISKQKARQLLVNAFIKEVINTISDDALREQLLNTIDGEIE